MMTKDVGHGNDKDAILRGIPCCSSPHDDIPCRRFEGWGVSGLLRGGLLMETCPNCGGFGMVR